MQIRFISYCCFLMNPVAVLAGKVVDSERPVMKTISYGDALNWSASLLVVLAVFFLCVWVIRKSGQLSATGRNNLSVLAGLSLGMREKVVLIKVGDKQLLLGVTPGRIDKLLELEGEDKLLQEYKNKNSAEFAKKLLLAMKGRSDA